jgi:CPA1 family monovalent cation:H+ antiporter
MLIGLELPEIIQALEPVSMSTAIKYSLIIAAVLIVCRILSTLGASVFTVFISRFITTADSRPGWRAPLLFGWAGMRGVVSLAAALSIPLYLNNGQPFPQRNLILFITFGVILVTLVVQGLSFPLLIKWVNMGDPDGYPPDEVQLRQIRHTLAEESIRFLEMQKNEQVQHNSLLQQLKDKFRQEQYLQDGDGMSELTIFGKTYLAVLQHQRSVLFRLNKDPEVNEEVIRNYLVLLDMEEEKVRSRYEVED